MPTRLKFRPFLLLMLLGLTGCAAPIKALFGEPAQLVDQAEPKADYKQDANLRAALIAKSRALLSSRGAQSPSELDVIPGTKPAMRGPKPAVSAMHVQARDAKPQPRRDSDWKPTQADLTQQSYVKDQTRFQNSPTGSREYKADQALIRITSGTTALDAEGTLAVQNLARQSELTPSSKLVLVAGLSGRGTPWERMQVASERLELIARHVPSQLKVERRFELELQNELVRLELHREGR